MKVACELRLCVSFCKSEAVGFVTSKHKFYPLVAEKNSDSVSVKIVFSISYYINKTCSAVLTSVHAHDYFHV